MTKSEKFFRFLISRYEQIARQGKKVVFFDTKGEEVKNDGPECKWWVADGVVYNNEEKVSGKMAKYSANLGMLY